jgi:hypothetical protein
MAEASIICYGMGRLSQDPVQRIGILILALSFFLVGAALYAIAYDQHSFSPFVVTLLMFSAGTKLTISACRGLGSSSK